MNARESVYSARQAITAEDFPLIQEQAAPKAFAALDAVLDQCDHIATDDQVKHLAEDIRAAITDALEPDWKKRGA